MGVGVWHVGWGALNLPPRIIFNLTPLPPVLLILPFENLRNSHLLRFVPLQ